MKDVIDQTLTPPIIAGAPTIKETNKIASMHTLTFIDYLDITFCFNKKEKRLGIRFLFLIAFESLDSNAPSSSIGLVRNHFDFYTWSP